MGMGMGIPHMQHFGVWDLVIAIACLLSLIAALGLKGVKAAKCLIIAQGTMSFKRNNI